MKRKKHISILILLYIVVHICIADDWSAFRGNMRRTGCTQEEVGIPSQSSLWTIQLDGSIASSPAVVDGKLFIGANDSTFYCIQASDGTVLWKKKTSGWITSSPLIHSGMVVVGSRDGHIYLFDVQTGDIISKLCGGVQLSSPGVTANGKILTGLGPWEDGFALYEWDHADPQWTIGFGQMSYSSPAIDQNTAVIGANDAKLYGINLESKDTIWSFKTAGGIFMSTPAIDSGIVYFAPGNYDMYVYAININSGSLVWKSNGTPVQSSKRLLMNKDRIKPWDFVELLKLSPEHRALAVRHIESMGKHVPKISAANADDDFVPYGGMKTSSVAVGPKNVFVIQKELGYPVARHSILALDKKTGQEKWFDTAYCDAPEVGYCSSPVVADGKVFFGWGEGRMYAYDTETGEKLWGASLTGGIISSPAISAGKLFVATYEGYLYAYDLTNTPDASNFNDGTFCYPNPGKTVSNIQVYATQDASVEIRLFNLAHRPVLRTTGTLNANEKWEYSWDLSNVANGVYFAKVTVTYSNGSKDEKILKIAVLK